MLNSDLLNLAEYPIDKPESARYRALVSDCREQLASGYLINIKDFLTPSGTEYLVQEIESRLPQAFHSVSRSNPHPASEADTIPPDQRYTGYTDRYSLARHQLTGSALDSLYQYPPLRRFIRDILALESIYLHEDPSNALVVQMYKPGGGIAWHFDQALFSTILNLRETEQGGVFECVPNLRTANDPCTEAIQQVLLKQSDRVEKHQVSAGSFTIMSGRYTMHRVTEVSGTTPRLSAVLSYEDRPGVKMDLATRKRLFGPTVTG